MSKQRNVSKSKPQRSSVIINRQTKPSRNAEMGESRPIVHTRAKPSHRSSRGGQRAFGRTPRSSNPNAVRKPRIANPQPRPESFEDLRDYELPDSFNPGDTEGSERGTVAARGLGLLDLYSSIGGLDGILSGMTKVQKVYTIFKQMGPVFKLIGGLGSFGSFGGLGMRGARKVKTSGLRAGKPYSATRKR